MIDALKYAKLTLKHKWFVFLAGRKLGLSWWRLFKHDWSKFLPSELPHYGRQFFGKADDPLGFAICWTRHQNRHEHHWEYWVPRTGHSRGGYGDGNPLPIPGSAYLEMIADWMGASRAYEGHWPNLSNWEWVNKNLPKMKIEKVTKEHILRLLRHMEQQQL